MTVERVRDYIRQGRLLEQNRKYLVALSGGADSVCLLLILKRLGYSVEAAHCNFNLRGKEAERDELFCVSFCEKQQILLHRVHFDTREYAALHHQSVEMAARELRYRYFAQLCHDISATAVCVAHHQDDSVETVLMNLTRGTGLHGLTGIRPVVVNEEWNISVIRPLLCLSRGEIEDYLLKAGQDYVTDSSNLRTDEAVRNKIRLELIPLLQRLNPSVKDSIAVTAHRLQEAAKVFDVAMKEQVNRVLDQEAKGDGMFTPVRLRLSVSRLRSLPSPEYTLYYILRDYGFSSAQIEQISGSLSAVSGSVFSSATHDLLIDRDSLLIEPHQETLRAMRIPEEGTYVYQTKSQGEHESHGVGEMVFRFTCCPSEAKVSRCKHVVTLDAKTISFPLLIRPVQQGDRFHPFGMKGSKLISDYLTDRKFSLFDKRRQLVVTDAANRILWLVNERPDESFRVTNNTQKILRIELVLNTSASSV